MPIQKKFFVKLKEKGIKPIIIHTIPWQLNDKMNKVISIIARKIFVHFPIQNVIIIESHNDFDSNGGAFYDYLIENGYNKNYKIIWFLRNKCPESLPENVEGYSYNRLSLKREYYYCVAKYIICGHFLLPVLREGQKSYYTTHGAFGLKAFKKNIAIPSGISYILSPSEDLLPLLANEYSIEYPNTKQIILGYPSHDVFYTNEAGDLHKITENKYKKVILWMPTFRKSVIGRRDSSSDNPLGIPIIASLQNYQQLNKKLQEQNTLLIIKIHPMQDMSTVKISSLSNILVLDGKSVKKLNIDNYKLMKDVDALISDYSSAAYDYLHLNRPIAYTMDDAETYNLGFIVDDPKKFMAGDILYNFEDFYNFVLKIIAEEDNYKIQRRELSKKIWKYHDGNSSKRLARHMGLKK